jgi:hypothetical protein
MGVGAQLSNSLAGQGTDPSPTCLVCGALRQKARNLAALPCSGTRGLTPVVSLCVYCLLQQSSLSMAKFIAGLFAGAKGLSIGLNLNVSHSKTQFCH